MGFIIGPTYLIISLSFFLSLSLSLSIYLSLSEANERARALTGMAAPPPARAKRQSLA